MGKMKHYWILKEELDADYDGINLAELKPDPDKIHNFEQLVKMSDYEKLEEKIAIMESYSSQFESTILETIKERDKVIKELEKK